MEKTDSYDKVVNQLSYYKNETTRLREMTEKHEKECRNILIIGFIMGFLVAALLAYVVI
jgi:hypothetical protein